LTFASLADVTSAFLKKNKLDLVIRSHECVDDGYEVRLC
jgi:hypothetical protein